MIRSLSLRSRFAAASRRASAEPRPALVDRDLLVLDRVPLLVERERLVALEREDCDDVERDDLPDVERDDLPDDDRVRREPAPEPDLPEPPLLACGMLPP
jgi:hypothetical protein